MSTTDETPEDDDKNVGVLPEVRDSEIDQTLIRLNKCIENLLKAYVPEAGGPFPNIEIRFDLPKADAPPMQATISVFLYDIQEDLQLRTSAEPRGYDISVGMLMPGFARVRCRYLITYWPVSASDEENTGMRSDGEQIRAINRMLNALLNHRTFKDLPGSYTRVIPPSEHLESLGTFWQALGNKPRLCLSYAVTVPIRLLSQKDEVALVTQPSSEVGRRDQVVSMEALSGWMRDKLVSELRSQQHKETLLMSLLAQLRGVQITCNPHLVPWDQRNSRDATPEVKFKLTGEVSQELVTAVGNFVAPLSGTGQTVGTQTVRIRDVDVKGLKAWPGQPS
ncbi:DUF4255 domain-containing protein [Burkholderia sp. Bp9126]|nr:DUF4255 domain-containing protein [Burkholderia sp. Bp9126]